MRMNRCADEIDKGEIDGQRICVCVCMCVLCSGEHEVIDGNRELSYVNFHVYLWF